MSSRWYSDYGKIRKELEEYQNKISPQQIITIQQQEERISTLDRLLREAEIKLNSNMPYLRQLQNENAILTKNRNELDEKNKQLRNEIDVVTKDRDQLKDAHDKLILQAKKAGEDFSQELRNIYGPVDKQYFVKF
jgi:predicted  nucleic acid-binding Zn-ribbon protein